MRGLAWRGASSSLITQAEWGVSQRHSPSLWSGLDREDLLNTHTETNILAHICTWNQGCQAHITRGSADWRIGEANVFTQGTEIDLHLGYNHAGQSHLPHYYSTSHIITRHLRPSARPHSQWPLTGPWTSSCARSSDEAPQPLPVCKAQQSTTC